MASDYVSDDEYWKSTNKGFNFDDSDWLPPLDNQRLPLKTSESCTPKTVNRYDSDASNESRIGTFHSSSSYSTFAEAPDSSDDLENIDSKVSSSTKYEWVFSLNTEVQTKPLLVPPLQAVRNMIYGVDYNLEKLKSLKDKRDLLYSAVKNHDGNAIITALLFLRSTLNQSIFSQEILAAPEYAQNEYISFLKNNRKFEELEHVLMLLRKDEDAALLKYERALNNLQASEVKLKKIENCFSTHFENSSLSHHNVQAVMEHLQLFKQQISLKQSHEEQSQTHFTRLTGKKEVIDSSVIDTLIFCCLHCDDKKSPINSILMTFKNIYDLSTKQCTWAAIRALTVLEKWTSIDDFFTSDKWFGSKKMKSCISFSNVIKTLQKLGAPAPLLGRFFEFVKDDETKLELAKRVKCHKVVIEILSSNKDRQGLEEYKSTFKVSSPEEITISNVLKNTKIKWKN